MSETVDKQTILVKSTNFGNPSDDKLGHVRLKKGREHQEEFEVIDTTDIDAKIEYVKGIDWLEEKMKNELVTLIIQMGETAAPAKTHATLMRTKINQE